jgi:hypothetical protein
MHDTPEVFSRSFIRGCSRLGVVAREDLRSMSLPLCDHADVESRIEELGRGELAESEDLPVEIKAGMARFCSVLPAFGGRDSKAGPVLAATELLADLAQGHPPLG